MALGASGGVGVPGFSAAPLAPYSLTAIPEYYVVNSSGALAPCPIGSTGFPGFKAAFFTVLYQLNVTKLLMYSTLLQI